MEGGVLILVTVPSITGLRNIGFCNSKLAGLGGALTETGVFILSVFTLRLERGVEISNCAKKSSSSSLNPILKKTCAPRATQCLKNGYCAPSKRNNPFSDLEPNMTSRSSEPSVTLTPYPMYFRSGYPYLICISSHPRTYFPTISSSSQKQLPSFLSFLGRCT